MRLYVVFLHVLWAFPFPVGDRASCRRRARGQSMDARRARGILPAACRGLGLSIALSTMRISLSQAYPRPFSQGVALVGDPCCAGCEGHPGVLLAQTFFGRH